MNLLKAALSISAMTFLSRITGLVLQVITANAFGAGMANDAFIAAWRIPNFLRRLFAEGAPNAVSMKRICWPIMWQASWRSSCLSSP